MTTDSPQGSSRLEGRVNPEFCTLNTIIPQIDVRKKSFQDKGRNEDTFEWRKTKNLLPVDLS